MTFTREQRQAAYKKLPIEVQEFIMSNETSDVIANYLKEVGLSDDQANFADGEIFNSLLGLQTLDASINNIIQLTGKRIEELSNLKSKLQENIFSKYKELGVVQKVEEKVVVWRAQAFQPALALF